MIHWTPLAMEDVFGSTIEEQSKPERMELDINGVRVEVSLLKANQVKIERILSSNPQDFLLEQLTPGNIVDLIPKG